MGYKLIVYGRIEGARDPNRDRDAAYPGAVYHYNRCALEALPDTDDEWPYLTRHMFAVASPSLEGGFDRGLFQGQIIHFGASLKADRLDQELQGLWLAKFETHLLKSLIWQSAGVHFEHELQTRATVHYKATQESLDEALDEFRQVGSKVQAEMDWRRSWKD